MLFKKQKKAPIRRPQAQHQEDYSFRRSRTLTGSTSAKVNPTVDKRAQLKTQRLKEHELREKHRRVVRLLLGLAAGVCLLLLLLVNIIQNPPIHYPQPGTTAPPSASYQQTLEQYFNTQPLERFGFSLNQGKLQDFMRDKHSEISTISTNQAWYGRVEEFIITFRKPLLVWQTGSNRFYVDDQGVSFTYDHFGSPLVAIEDQSGITPDVGTSVASVRFIRFLGKMVGAINAGHNARVAGVIIPSSTRQIDIKLEGRDYLIKTHINRDPLQQAEDVLRALHYFDQKGITPAYIDVRVGGRAFYK